MSSTLQAPRKRGINKPAARVHTALVMILVIAVCVGVPLILASITGSLSIPHNDAWSHSKIAHVFATTGRFELVGWNRTALAGQVVVLGPLGRSIIVQQLFVAALAAATLWATYAFLTPRIGHNRALFGAAVVGVLPEFGLLSTSYMSDIPAFFAVMMCLVLGDRALTRNSQWFLAAALAVGTWGVTIREQTLVAPVGVALLALITWRGWQRIIAACQTTIMLMLVLVFERWRRSLPWGDSPTFHIDPGNAALSILEGLVILPLYLLPVAFFTARPLQWSIRSRWVAGITAIVVYCLAMVLERPFSRNYIEQSGAYNDAFLGTRVVFSDGAWGFVLAIAGLSAGLIAGVFIEHGARWDRLSAIVATLFALGTIGQTAVGQLFFSRYLLPLVPLLCGALLAAPVAARRLWGIVGVSLSLALSLALTSNALVYDAARWQAASDLQAQGIPSMDIDAGIEWLGWHSSGPAAGGSGPVGAGGLTSLFHDARACYVVSASELPNYDVIAVRNYRTFAVIGTSKMWIQKARNC